MTLIVGVTGGIGSGKSAATDHFASLGITIVDADLVSRIIVEPGRPALTAIAEHFGAEILQADGQLDRAVLRQKVFTDSAEREWLEQLTHPLIGEEIIRQLAQSQSAYTILASPLLLETSQKDLCAITVVVDVPEELQLQRTMARDANDEAQVRRIMAAQMSRQQRLQLADEVVDNSGDLAGLYGRVEQLHQQFLEQCSI
ncbi:dephospho-CoA kinase [Halieaceae bacterium IMCC14734]|uniref:Dephospho-CoA kinase n=1 Tax=Candidatus Litorirhabdus singularis TaxID=2518993 RepID=A0ABT3TM16_9GAMM|nr:dephospho-CoA kinase [Candidatus Litorirhabdus singularis]MCX2982382.1 dephospho-CoA kinase [Candidatus Litorirhabdus singularis]